jgi:pimeloyl-ACP methyl ester carboxylesterase
VVLWTVASDLVVKRGKATIEEEMIGRVQTSRSWKERFEVGTSGIALIILLICVFLTTITLIIRSVDNRVSPPGNRISVNSNRYRLHLHCEGNVTDSKGQKMPTVLLEGGEDAVENGLWQLAEEMVRNGSISRYCFIDRPGYGWSDAAPSPTSAGMEVMAVNEALAKAGERGPWVIVSAGLGSIYSRIFAAQHGKDIKGLIFIDPLHEDYLNGVGSGVRRFLLWVRGIASPLGLDRVPAAIFSGRSSADRIWGSSSRQSGKYIFSKLQEALMATTFTKREVVSSRTTQRQNTPLTVITSGDQLKEDSNWDAAQRDLTKLTANLKHWDIVDDAPHRVWDTEAGRDRIAKRVEQMVNL